MPTINVRITQCWMNATADLTDAMGFALNALDHAPVVAVQSRQYAGGNYRAVRTPGLQKVAKVTLGFCTDAQTAWLKAHQGVLLCFRDARGEKFFGVYVDSTFSPRFIADSWSVPLTFTQVTFSEAV